MIEWISNLNAEQYFVLCYMIFGGIAYGFQTTIMYIRGLMHNVRVTNDFLGVTVLLGWYFSIAYWFIF